MLWIALFAPELPLRAALGGEGVLRALTNQAIVIGHGPDARLTLRACNEHARQHGIREGMGVSEARALVASLTVVPRQCDAEDALLIAMATLVLRYTPMVCIEADRERHCVCLEVSASLKLFGGVHTLLQHLQAQLNAPLQQQRFGRVAVGLAPTPLAAELLARQRALGARGQSCLPHQDVREAIGSIALAIVPWLAPQVPDLIVLGLHTLGEVLALPREGFARRFGQALRNDLDRCIGAVADPRQPYIPAAQFVQRVDCLVALEEGPHLMCGIGQALAALQDWLRARASGTRAFELELIHSRERVSRYPVTLSEISCDPQRWQVLLVEHFQRRPVNEPVHAIALHCHEYESLQQAHQSLFTQNTIRTDSWEALLDRLLARLGPDALYQLRVHADHRPEQAHATCPPLGPRNHAHEDKPAMPSPMRPMFLLRRPHALISQNGLPTHHGVLTLLTEPERIQSGWWDDAPVQRDYFIAQNTQGTLCWVYRTLHESDRWYLHGFFA